ncbi:MAG: DICT sensory domain-containing protein [Anaerolineales bacterium]
MTTLDRNILTQFFGKLLPLFPPRAEAFLKSANAEDLQRVNFRYIFTVEGMVEISHLIEDFVLANPGAADMHVSFQAFSRFADQQERYTRLADSVKGLWLYGVPDVPPPQLPRTTIVDTAGTPLERYWFVIAYGPGVHMTLLAEEVSPEDRLPHEPRMYEGFYTFDPNFAYKVLDVLHMLFSERIPQPVPPELLD